MNIYLWVLIFCFYCFQAYISRLNNIFGGTWFWFAWLISVIPIWTLIARHSKSLLIDGIIYDILLFLSYVITLIFLGEGKVFNWLQWIGLGITIIGVFLMKVRI